MKVEIGHFFLAKLKRYIIIIQNCIFFGFSNLSRSVFFLELSLIADVINKVAPLLNTAPPSTKAENST